MISTIDAVLLRILDNQLQVLLWQRPAESEVFASHWALPGGWVYEDTDQTLEEATCRILENKVGLTPDYIEQVVTVGNNHRDPRGWSTTVLHLALIRTSISSVTHSDTQWVNVENILERRLLLPFDHALLLETALERLSTKARITSYNVCYTKLLRSAYRNLAQTASIQRTDSGLGLDLKLRLETRTAALVSEIDALLRGYTN